jgi:hypothetical protein
MLLCRLLALARVVQMLLLLRRGWRGYSRHRVAVNAAARLLFCLVLHPALIHAAVRSPSFIGASWLQPSGGGPITSGGAAIKALLVPTGEAAAALGGGSTAWGARCSPGQPAAAAGGGAGAQPAACELRLAAPPNPAGVSAALLPSLLFHVPFRCACWLA